MKWWIVAAIGGRLLACTTVDGDRIRGAELAAADAHFASLDPALDLGPAPLAGTRRILRAREIAQLAVAHGIAESPAEMCFERAAHKLSAQELFPVLRAALGREDVEILDFSKFVVPTGSLEFTREGLSASGFWRGRVMNAAVWVKIRVADSEGARVERGEAVRVEVRSGGVLLAFDASAESTGRTGELVIVKNPQNGRRFQARVDGKGKVSIKK